MKQIVLTVNKEDVTIQDKRMHKYLYSVNQVSPETSMKELQAAYRHLCIAKGMYYYGHGLKLFTYPNRIGEDIDRIENKINGLIEEKLRKHRKR